MDSRKFIVSLPPDNAAVVRHLLPFIAIVSSSSQRDLGINLLGFDDKMDYVRAVSEDDSYGEMLSVILLLFQLEDGDDRDNFFKRITFLDKVLEKRLRKICGIRDSGVSVEDLEFMWEQNTDLDEWWDTKLD